MKISYRKTGPDEFRIWFHFEVISLRDMELLKAAVREINRLTDTRSIVLEEVQDD